MSNQILTALKQEFDRRVYEEGVARIIKVIGLLSDEDIWYVPNSASNSVGILVLHLCGNVTQWVGAGIGGIQDKRERKLEFAPEVKPCREELIRDLKILHPLTNRAFSTLLNDNDLMSPRNVQGFDETVLSIIVHVIEHFSYHVGQIALIAKHLKGQDLGFYADMDLSIIGNS